MKIVEPYNEYNIMDRTTEYYNQVAEIFDKVRPETRIILAIFNYYSKY